MVEPYTKNKYIVTLLLDITAMNEEVALRKANYFCYRFGEEFNPRVGKIE